MSLRRERYTVAVLYHLAVFPVGKPESALYMYMACSWEEVYTVLNQEVEIEVCSNINLLLMCCLSQNSFELFGADFMLTEDLKPWLVSLPA